MPSIYCEPGGLSDSTADSSGSTAKTSRSGFSRLRALLIPSIECAVLTVCQRVNVDLAFCLEP